MNIELDLLRTVVAVADTGGLTAAGRRLGLSQPAVHQQLARLADQVGAALYHRQGRGVRLTPVGRQLAALGRRVARDRDDTVAAIVGRSGPPPIVWAGRGVWRDLVTQLPRCRPVVADGPATVQAVHDGAALLGIAAMPPAQGLSDGVVREVCEVLAVPIGDPLVDRGPVDWPDLRGRAWVLPPSTRPLRQAVEARAGPCRIAVEVEGWDLLQRFAVLSGGITILNDSVEARPGLIRVPLAQPATTAYRAFWRPGVDVSVLLASLGLSLG